MMQWLKSPLPPSDSDMSKTPESARDVPTRVRHGDTLLNQHQLFLWWCIAHVSFVVIRLTQSKAGMTRALPRTESGSVRTVACPRCTGLCRSSLRSLAVAEGGARVLSGHLLFSGQVFLVKHESVARATKHGAKEADGKVVLSTIPTREKSRRRLVMASVTSASARRSCVQASALTNCCPSLWMGMRTWQPASNFANSSSLLGGSVEGQPWQWSAYAERILCSGSRSMLAALPPHLASNHIPK